MAQWMYSDWRRESSTQEQLDRLNLHIEEVTDRLGTEKSAMGMSSSSYVLERYLANLDEQADKLEAKVQMASIDVGKGRLRAVFK